MPSDRMREQAAAELARAILKQLHPAQRVDADQLLLPM